MTWLRGRASSSPTTQRDMRDRCETERRMDREFFTISMEGCIMEIGKMTSFMVTVLNRELTFTKDSGSAESSTVKATLK